MLDLVKSYELYYKNPSTDGVRQLYESIVAYDFDNYVEDIDRIKFIKLSHGFKVPDKLLRSSGSSGKPSNYWFGPHGDLWITSIEKFLKTNDYPNCFLNNRFFFDKHFEHKLIHRNHFLQTYVCMLNFHLKDAIEVLIDFLAILFQKHDKINLVGMPNFFLYIFQIDKVRDFIINHKDNVESISSTGFDSLYKKEFLICNGIYVNDNMINWQTGLNFYTCKFNTIHFLPIFHFNDHYNNLINLSDKDRVMDDSIEFGKLTVCKCGRRFVPIRIKPHYQYWHDLCDLSIIEHLSTKFLSLQFIQKDEGIDVLYVSIGKDISSNDKEIIKSLSNKNMKFIRNMYLETGMSKVAPFWKNIDNRSYKKYIPPLFI